LRELDRLVVVIDADHVGGKPAEKADSEEAGNLSAILPSSINARVMLTENVWTENVMVNSAFGVVQDIIWSPHTTDCRQQPPHAILVAFDKYDGPEFILDPKTGQKLVPIIRSKREWSRAGDQVFSRTRFPLTVAYAITIHIAKASLLIVLC
jgi:hypothetical protein